MDIQAVVTLPYTNAIERDCAVNTFTIEAPLADGPDDLTPGEITIPLANFYKEAKSTLNSLGAFMSEAITRAVGGCRIDLYDITAHLDGSPHGSPFFSDAFQLSAAASSTGLPEEVALVSTLRANNWDLQPIESPDGSDAGTARDRGRQRYSGRIYLGPWNTNATTSASGFSRPKADLINTILECWEDLGTQLAVVGDSGPFYPCVWSRADQQTRRVDVVQVDNAWDTVRGRGVTATVRETVDLA